MKSWVFPRFGDCLWVMFMVFTWNDLRGTKCCPFFSSIKISAPVHIFIAGLAVLNIKLQNHWVWHHQQTDIEVPVLLFLLYMAFFWLAKPLNKHIYETAIECWGCRWGLVECRHGLVYSPTTSLLTSCHDIWIDLLAHTHTPFNQNQAGITLASPRPPGT